MKDQLRLLRIQKMADEIQQAVNWSGFNVGERELKMIIDHLASVVGLFAQKEMDPNFETHDPMVLIEEKMKVTFNDIVDKKEQAYQAVFMKVS